MPKPRTERAAGRNAEPLGPVLEFMSLLWAVNHGLDSLSKRMDAAFGVTGAQRLVLRIVGCMPGIGAGALAEILRIHPSTLTGIMRRLVERGLIARARDPGDGRKAVLTLTSSGRMIDTLRAGTVEAAVRKMLKRFSTGEVEATARLLAATAVRLEAETRVKPPRRRRIAIARGARRTYSSLSSKH